MTSSIATITSKGQVTIPAQVRKDLAVSAGDRLEFVAVAPGQYLVTAQPKESKGRDVRELKGMFGKARKTLTIEAMNAVIAARGGSAR